MTIQLVSGGDWQGLYIDGVLKVQNHSLYACDVLDALEGILKVQYIEADEDWMAKVGQLPDKLKDVKKQKK